MGQAASEDLGRKIGSTLATERTFGNDPGIRHGADRRLDILTALLAADGEVAPLSFRKAEHKGQYRRTEGENPIVHFGKFGFEEPIGG